MDVQEAFLSYGMFDYMSRYFLALQNNLILKWKVYTDLTYRMGESLPGEIFVTQPKIRHFRQTKNSSNKSKRIFDWSKSEPRREASNSHKL